MYVFERNNLKHFENDNILILKNAFIFFYVCTRTYL